MHGEYTSMSSTIMSDTTMSDTSKDFVVGVPTLNRPDTLYVLLLSVLKSTVRPKFFVIIDNSGGTITQELQQREIPHDLIPAAQEIQLAFHIAEHNLGVAASWNAVLELYHDYPVIMSNDDVELDPHALEYLLEHAHDDVVACGDTISGNAFSLFLLPHHIYRAVGEFDTHFYPAYFEDNDYYWRMHTQGYELLQLPNVRYTHVGSATLQNYTPEQRLQHHKDFEANRAYYIEKWGGLPGFETYRKPFNT